ncbi:Clp protease ClpP [Desulfovibrio sp. SGI.169]|uniref:Clp protease ClpP n=1 Tax=Desulfovibrio sp. SGI.169 TaxID=3420561 RepID=UPI003CFBF1F5
MMLNIKEKLTLQRAVKEGLDKLKSGIKDIRQRLATQRQIKEALDKLKGVSGGDSQSLFEQLIAGKFLKEVPARFLAILKKALAEVNGNIQMIQDPVIAYLAEHHSEEGVFESADVSSFLPVRPFDAKNQANGAVRSLPKGLEYGAPQNIIIDIDTDFESPETFRGIIRAIEQAREVDTVTLKINSHGGRTDSAQAVYAALMECKAKTIARIITAYSSGSIVAMSCDEIQTTPHCTMMIHNASGFSWGKVGDMKAQSTFLEKHFRKWFDELYSGFLTAEEIADVLKGQEVWLREEDIKSRLPKWRPIRERRGAEAQANNAG